MTTDKSFFFFVCCAFISSVLAGFINPEKHFLISLTVLFGFGAIFFLGISLTGDIFNEVEKLNRKENQQIEGEKFTNWGKPEEG